MSQRATQARRDGDLLSQALKLVRRYRGLTAVEVAAAMHMPVRTYERFEAGEGRFNVDYVHRFAAATDSDPHAITMAVDVGSPDLAWRSADNKLITVMTIGAQRFNADCGDLLHLLEARDGISVVTAMFQQLRQLAEARAVAARWLEDGAADLSAMRPKPGR